MTEGTKRRLRRLLFATSVLLNVTLAYIVADDKLNGPAARVGVLTKDLEIGSFSGTETMFRLPKGLTVRDASPRFLAAVSLFEPHRFSIIITSDDETLVDYRVPPAQLRTDYEYDSADLQVRRADEREEAAKTTNDAAR